MTPHFLAGMKPELLLTAQRGSLLVFSIYERTALCVPPFSGPVLGIVTWQAASVHFCHRDYKTQETALVAQVAWQ